VRPAILAAATTLLLAACVGGDAALGAARARDGSPSAVYDAVCELVARHFYDPELRGLDWAALRREHSAAAAACRDTGELSAVLGPMLAALDTSHTRFVTARDAAFYDLAGIFGLGPEYPELFDDGVVSYDGLGLLGRAVPGGYLVQGVLHGGPAARAGLLTGDLILSADGRPFGEVSSAAGRAGHELSLSVRRRRGEPALRIDVVPERIEPQELLLAASVASMELVDVDSARVAYVRVWSYADPRVHEALVQALTSGELRDADALVLDLRGGWGGADPAYLDFFNQAVPQLEFVARDGTRSVFDQRWRRPVVLLVDAGTRSGKELLAHAFRRHAIGPVVGQRTAGAATGGRAFPVGRDALLYLAVMDALVDGERLEGVGVEPDVTVPFELPFSAGADPQRDVALRLAASEAAAARPARGH